MEKQRNGKNIGLCFGGHINLRFGRELAQRFRNPFDTCGSCGHPVASCGCGHHQAAAVAPPCVVAAPPINCAPPPQVTCAQPKPVATYAPPQVTCTQPQPVVQTHTRMQPVVETQISRNNSPSTRMSRALIIGWNNKM